MLPIGASNREIIGLQFINHLHLQASSSVMTTTYQSYTVVVVSDQDFKAHIDGNELIDETNYLTWRQDHRECTFEASDVDRDTLMRTAVAKHVNVHTENMDSILTKWSKSILLLHDPAISFDPQSVSGNLPTRSLVTWFM
jgi:hypothetical protein